VFLEFAEPKIKLIANLGLVFDGRELFRFDEEDVRSFTGVPLKDDYRTQPRRAGYAHRHSSLIERRPESITVSPFDIHSGAFPSLAGLRCDGSTDRGQRLDHLCLSVLGMCGFHRDRAVNAILA